MSPATVPPEASVALGFFRRLDARTAVFGAGVLLASLLAWLTLAAWGSSADARYHGHGEDVLAPEGVLAATFIVGWLVMLVAMMLPTSLPLVSLFQTITRERADAIRLVGLLVLAYLAVWTLFGVAFYAVDRGAHLLLQASVGPGSWPRGVVSAVLLLAGAYQFSDLKYHCLTACRSPRHFVLTHWRGEQPAREAWRLGLDHGLYCVGCCWTIMVVMIVVGLGSVGWMLLLGAAMALEKNVSWGNAVRIPLGVGLAAGGVLTWFWPSGA